MNSTYLLQVYLASEQWQLDGHSWYIRANKFAAGLASECSQTLDTTCAVISALSPGITWFQNQVIARQLCLASVGQFGSLPDSFPLRGAYRRNANKAWRMLHGSVPNKEMNPVSGPKTFCFWKNLVDPASAEHVTIDRHAAAIARGQTVTKQVSITPCQYLALADCYRQAARQIGVIPCQLQATVWLSHRDHYQQSLFT